MRIIRTDEVLPTDFKSQEKDWIYNGLDCCVTAEILDVLLPQLDNLTASTYTFSKSLQGPVLEMRLRGVLIDQARKNEVIEEYFELTERLDAQLQRIVGEAFGMWGFNWRPNSKDLPKLFYEVMEIPPIKKGGRPTCDRTALEKLEGYFVATQVVKHIILLRELMKKISMLRTEIDADGRMRTSYNIAGTNTGRFSSSFSEFGTGGNFQNIEESLRSVFTSDPGMKFAYLDGEQIQSRIVGAVEWNLFNDARYLDACETGDLHTTVAKLCWPGMPWTGNIKKDKEIAEQVFYRHYTYRFMCKKVGHGTNFDGKPDEISRQTKIEKGIIEDFQPKYFRAFPAHSLWKEWIRRQLIEFGYIVNLTGRKRWFFGRRNDDATVREALAYEGQASEAGIVNTGMLNVWHHRDCQLMMQGHDSILVQYPEEREDEIIPKLKKQLRYPIQLEHDREFIVPYGCTTGWNFGSCTEENPDGLKAYTPGDKRRRTPQAGILDRPLRKVYRQSGKRAAI
jgi:DNA polymerase-1